MTTALAKKLEPPRTKLATNAVTDWLASGATWCDTPECKSVHQPGEGWAGWATDATGLRRCPDCLAADEWPGPAATAEAAAAREAAYMKARTDMHATADRVHYELLGVHGVQPWWETPRPLPAVPATACSPPAPPLIAAAMIGTALPGRAHEDQPTVRLRLEPGGGGHFVPADPAATRTDLPVIDAPLGPLTNSAEAHLAALVAKRDENEAREAAKARTGPLHTAGKWQDSGWYGEAPAGTPGPVPVTDPPAGPGAASEDEAEPE
jgi:hypothetical protein